MKSEKRKWKALPTLRELASYSRMSALLVYQNGSKGPRVKQGGYLSAILRKLCSFSPKQRSPQSPKPGTMYLFSFMP